MTNRKAFHCSMDGCGQVHYSLGYCRMHYERHRGGTELDRPRLITRGAAKAEFDRIMALPDTDDCIIWPLGKSPLGYGVASSLGKSSFVHHHICVAKHGPKPFPTAVAAHSCQNGHLGCVNPNHVRWLTQSENMKEAWASGRIGKRNYRRIPLVEKELVKLLVIDGLSNRAIKNLVGTHTTSVQAIRAKMGGENRCR